MSVSAFVDAFNQALQESDLSSQIDGSTQTFVLPVPIDTTSLVIYFNGVRQRTGVEVTVLTSTTFSVAFVPPINTVLVAVYKPI